MGFVAYYWLNPPLTLPSLELREAFPKGFDTRDAPLRAIAYDGVSKCTSIWEMAGLNEDDWGRKGTMAAHDPTAKEIRNANRITNPDYNVRSYTKQPVLRDNELLDEIILKEQPNCAFQYVGEIWEVSAKIGNVKSTLIPDREGNPFRYALTSVRFGGISDIEVGARFLLLGRAQAPSALTLDFRVFNSGDYEPDQVLHKSLAAPIFTNETHFAFVFDIPPVGVDQAELMMIPTTGNASHVRSPVDAGLQFDGLWRLEDGGLAAHVVPRGLDMDATNVHTLAGVRELDARSLEEAVGYVRQDAAELEGASAVAVITFIAVEPGASPGSLKSVQARTAGELTSSTSLEVTDGETTHRSKVVHRWAMHPSGGKLTVQVATQRATTGAAKLAAVTASVTQLGADGKVAANAIRTGETFDGAVVAVSRAISVRGHLEDLDDLSKPASTRGLLRASDKFFLTAGGIHAAWEWSLARSDPDPIERFRHGTNALRIAAFSVFQLSPQGMLFVAASELGEYLFEKTGAFDDDGALMTAAVEVQAFVFGDVPPETAAKSRVIAGNQLETYAAQYNAALRSPDEVRKTTPTEFFAGGIVVFMLAAGALFLFIRFKGG